MKGLLGLPGIHYLLTRFGPTKLRAASFDQKYSSGDWVYALDSSAELVSIVEKYACKGQILMLGCGSASVATAISADSFAGFVGVDLSPEAINHASRQSNDKIRFVVGDLLKYRCDRKYDLILFSESLYYISPLQRKPLLHRLAGELTQRGSIVVTIADPVRYAGILEMIRKNFLVKEDRSFKGGQRHLIAFR